MYELYWNLFEAGWTLEDIDNMDLFYYLDLLIYKVNKKENQNKIPSATIDQVL